MSFADFIRSQVRTPPQSWNRQQRTSIVGKLKIQHKENRMAIPFLHPVLMGLKSRTLRARSLHLMKASKVYNHPNKRIGLTSFSPDQIGIW